MECPKCGKEVKNYTELFDCCSTPNLKFSALLYGAVEWINDNPILDGMKYFETKEHCIEYIGEKQKMAVPPGIDVKYTIIRLEKAI